MLRRDYVASSISLVLEIMLGYAHSPLHAKNQGVETGNEATCMVMYIHVALEIALLQVNSIRMESSLTGPEPVSYRL